MGSHNVIQITSAAELEQAFTIRREVFVEEQGISEALEIDGQDDHALHLLARVGGQAVGTLRLRQLAEGRIAKVERVAVLKTHRGTGVGIALMEAAVEVARRHGAIEAKLHAQTTVERFYSGLGFASYGEIFEEDGIPHIMMKRRLIES